MIRTLSFDAPAWDKREIMRYARIRGADNSYDSLIDDCIREAQPILTYRVCYTVLPVNTDGSITIGNERVDSQTIGKAIRDSKQVILFAATVGAPFDRLIARYSRVEPSKALILQAIGAERVESLCDAFCSRMNTELRDAGKCLTRRVSPGYGDIPLDLQKEIFAVLDCPRKIGLTLDQSLLMSPSKSVTAIAGITDECEEQSDKCAACNKTDCAYRK
ncbi:hypothetical protein [Ruminococcus sp.]|uniref:hypothetical protein n=1 Tax=Ruminococcus sp. TaxID=41978 RepID=UPI00386C0ABA